MPTVKECVCCCEIDQIVERKQESFNGCDPPPCITQHEGFESVCLNVWVLQTAYFAYRYHYGDLDSITHELVIHLVCTIKRPVYDSVQYCTGNTDSSHIAN